ncbi:MAG TPA: V-type ATP synthase subunit D [Bacillota bacterium]|nr:V-type ATP synthase subunit D [Bacillota bacterium]HOH09662.1 V-type ATP synthase subunit D [Bacillota bacterium]HOS50296.1 V-type ATP synthase subunit D [Bacillota bacterium]HOY88956.1 V-type ATP synthase subunit D [Bacillota bacterium]HPI00549.1 V-type ATP synthase subunit D [Bacillota bacterium]
MQTNVSPTRMQLQKLKRRYAVARRGHKLLKDKLDELLKNFMELVRRNRDLRTAVDAALAEAFTGFTVARAVMSSAAVEEALMFPKERASVTASSRNLMSVQVPTLKWDFEEQKDRSQIYPYGFALTSVELDRAIKLLSDTMPLLIELAEVEKSVELLAEAIEGTRRRVNALEHILIPQLETDIKYIRMKLEEAERSNLTRLMKVKDIVRAKSI